MFSKGRHSYITASLDTPGPGSYDARLRDTAKANTFEHSNRFDSEKENGDNHNQPSSQETTLAPTPRGEEATKPETLRLKDDITSLRAKIKADAKTTSTLEKELEIQIKELERSNLRCQQNDVKIARLLQERNQLESKKASLEKEIKDLLARNTILSKELEKHDKRSLSLESAAKSLDSLQKTYDDTKTELSRVQTELEKKVEVIDGLQKENARLNKKGLDRESQCVNLEKKLAQAENERDSFVKQVQELQLVIESVADETMLMRRELSEIFSLPSIDENESDICLTLKFLRDSYTQLILQESQSGNEIKKLLTIAQNDCTVLSEQFESVRKECIELREMVESQKKVESELLEVRVQLADEQHKSESILETINELSFVQIENEERIAKANRSISSLQTHISSLTERENLIKDELETAKTLLVKETSLTQTLTSEIREKEIQINNIKSLFEENQSQSFNKIEELQQSLFEKEQSIFFTQNQLDLAKEREDKLKETLAIHEQENRDLAKELNKTRALLEVELDNVLLLALELEQIEAKIESNAELQQVKSNLNAKEVELLSIQEQFYLLQGEVGSFTQSIITKENENQTLDTELLRTKETLASTILSSQQKIEQSQEKEQNLLHKLQIVTQERNQVFTELQSTKDRLLEQTQNLTAKEIALQKANTEISDISSKFATQTLTFEKKSLQLTAELKRVNVSLSKEIENSNNKSIEIQEAKSILSDAHNQISDLYRFLELEEEESLNKQNQLSFVFDEATKAIEHLTFVIETERSLLDQQQTRDEFCVKDSIQANLEKTRILYEKESQKLFLTTEELVKEQLELFQAKSEVDKLSQIISANECKLNETMNQLFLSQEENRKLKGEIANMEEKGFFALKQQQQLKDQLALQIKKSAEIETSFNQQLFHSQNEINRLTDLVTLTESSLSSAQKKFHNTQMEYENELRTAIQQNTVLEAELNNTKNIVAGLCVELEEKAEQIESQKLAHIETAIHPRNNNNTNFRLILVSILIIVGIISSAAIAFLNLEDEGQYNLSGFRYPAPGIV